VKGISKVLIIMLLLLIALVVTAPCVTYASNISIGTQSSKQNGNSKKLGPRKNVNSRSKQGMLELQPDDPDKLVGLASTLASEHKFREAINIYTWLTKCHPERKDMWFEFADMYVTSNEYLSALALMQQYQSRFGTTKEYWRRLARILVAAGRYDSSMRINECLLAEETGKKPAYFDYLMATRILDLAAPNCQCAAVKELGLLKLYAPYSSEAIGAAKQVLTPLRNNITFSPDYYSDSVPVSVMRVPIDLQYFLKSQSQLII
jgi:tetratricopeptide (TPR) repeat protein